MQTIIGFFVLSAISSLAVTQQFLSCGNGAESSCCDKHPSCASWARRGECSKNPKWMLPNCQLSCHSCENDRDKRSTDATQCGTGRESNCCDKHPSCASWARRGECSKNPKWMVPNCQLSCHSCGNDRDKRSTDATQCGTGEESNCCDKHPSCASWASRGECSNNPEYMLSNCQLSCHSCETDNNETSDESSDTLKCGTGSQSNCCDKHPHCESWASEGQCDSNPSWMLPNCQFSCQDCENEPDEPSVDPELCGTGEKSDCCDFHASCPHWASVGECTRNRNYMHLNCMLSCNTCLTDPDPIVRQLAKRLGTKHNLTAKTLS